MSIENEIETKEKERKSAIDMATLKSELLKAGKRKERRERARNRQEQREKAQWIWQHRHGNLTKKSRRETKRITE